MPRGSSGPRIDSMASNFEALCNRATRPESGVNSRALPQQWALEFGAGPHPLAASYAKGPTVYTNVHRHESCELERHRDACNAMTRALQRMAGLAITQPRRGRTGRQIAAARFESPNVNAQHFGEFATARMNKRDLAPQLLLNISRQVFTRAC